MERKTINEFQAEAERHVSEGQANIAMMSALIDEMRRDGRDTGAAEMALQRFRDIQSGFVVVRDRLRARSAAVHGGEKVRPGSP